MGTGLGMGGLNNPMNSGLGGLSLAGTQKGMVLAVHTHTFVYSSITEWSH